MSSRLLDSCVRPSVLCIGVVCLLLPLFGHAKDWCPAAADSHAVHSDVEWLEGPGLRNHYRAVSSSRKNLPFTCALCNSPSTSERSIVDVAPSTTPEEKGPAPKRIVNENPEIVPPVDGFAHPMSRMKTIRGFDGAKCMHQGLDIYSEDEYFGTGQPIYAITRSEVTFIGTPEKNSRSYGRRDLREGTVRRSRIDIPRQMDVEGYGTVYPFTRNLGRARTGVFVVTKSRHPDYEDYLIRYMHLAAVHPTIKVGDILEKGQEIGLMGSTAIMKSLPHLHLDMETQKGLRVNPAPLVGLQKLLPSKCRPRTRSSLVRMKRRYIVRRGDSLWKIARKHKTTVKKLRRLNRLRRGRYLRIGQKLRVR